LIDSFNQRLTPIPVCQIQAEKRRQHGPVEAQSAAGAVFDDRNGQTIIEGILPWICFGSGKMLVDNSSIAESLSENGGMKPMPEINPQRLMNDLKHLRTIGKYGTGVVRPAFSAKDMEARQWLLDRMKEADLEATMDGVGNVFGRSPHPGKSVLIGSHTDTQPQGGWLDGSLGVIYGLEIARSFAEDRDTAHLAVDVASWSDEEGTYMGMLGSRSFCNTLNLDDMQRAQNRIPSH
jgi:hypothetical protein